MLTMNCDSNGETTSFSLPLLTKVQVGRLTCFLYLYSVIAHAATGTPDMSH